MMSFEFRFAMAVVGATLGALIGNRFLHVDRNAPTFFAITGGVLFYIAASQLLIVGLVASLVLALWHLRQLFPWLRQFGAALISQTNAFVERRYANFFRSGEQARTHYEERVGWFEDLPVDDNDIDDLKEKEKSRFVDAISSLSDRFGYDANQTRSNQPGTSTGRNAASPRTFRDFFAMPDDDDDSDIW